MSLEYACIFRTFCFNRGWMSVNNGIPRNIAFNKADLSGICLFSLSDSIRSTLMALKIGRLLIPSLGFGDQPHERNREAWK